MAVVTWSRAGHTPSDAAYPFVLERVPLLPSRAARVSRLIPCLLRRLRRADVVHVNGLLFPTFLANRVARRPAAAKVVGDMAWEYARTHGLSADDIDAFQHRPQPRAVEWRRRLRARALCRMEAVIVPSRYLAGLVTGWGVAAERVHVIGNALAPVAGAEGGMDHGASARQASDIAGATVRRIVTVCRLVPWKGVDELIDAVADLSGVELIVIGDGPERPRLEARARERRCADRVRFAGVLDAAASRACLAAADVFGLASRYEGFPHVVLEAYAAGVPVVATAAAGIPEAVVHGTSGLLVAPGDRRGLAGAIRLVLDDAALRRRLVEGGRAVAARHTVNAMVDATEDLVSRIAGRPVSRAAVSA